MMTLRPPRLSCCYVFLSIDRSIMSRCLYFAFLLLILFCLFVFSASFVSPCVLFFLRRRKKKKKEEKRRKKKKKEEKRRKKEKKEERRILLCLSICLLLRLSFLLLLHPLLRLLCMPTCIRRAYVQLFSHWCI